VVQLGASEEGETEGHGPVNTEFGKKKEKKKRRRREEVEGREVETTHV
jgi:hypothetical protein